MLTYYGLWSAAAGTWLMKEYDLIINSMSLPRILATCQAVNKWRDIGNGVTDWQVKIIGDDGLPVDLPED